jgi:hypothetical protein
MLLLLYGSASRGMWTLVFPVYLRLYLRKMPLAGCSARGVGNIQHYGTGDRLRPPSVHPTVHNGSVPDVMDFDHARIMANGLRLTTNTQLGLADEVTRLTRKIMTKAQ